MNQITCTLARTANEMDEAFRLRYACYRRSGAIADRPNSRFSDHYDTLPNHFTFLLGSAAEGTMATVRISVVRADLGWNTAPSCKVFGDVPDFRSIASDSFVEASRLCFVEQARRDVLYRLVANMAAVADLYSVRWLVACPREEHSAIYQRLFGFTPIAPPRKYLGVNFRTELLATERDDLRLAASRVSPMRKAWSAAAACLEETLTMAVCA